MKPGSISFSPPTGSGSVEVGKFERFLTSFSSTDLYSTIKFKAISAYSSIKICSIHLNVKNDFY